MLLRSHEELDFFARVFQQANMSNITVFTDTVEAYEVCIRKQFDLFVVRMEVDPYPGIVFIQNIRATGNYGHEAHFFVADKIDDKIIGTLHDLDIHYVLVKPFTPDRIKEKLKSIIQKEASLTSKDFLYRDSRSALQNKLLEMSESKCDELLKEEPSSERVFILQGDICLYKEDYEGARKFYNKALSVNPKSAASIDKIAHTHIMQKDYVTAAKLLDKIADLNPYNVGIMTNAGLSNYEIGNLEKAEKYMTQLSKIGAENKSSTETMAKIAADKGDYEGVMKSAMKHHSGKELVSLLNNKAVAISKANPEKAIELYEKSVRALKDNPYVYAIYFNMALAYKRLEEYNQAKVYFIKAIECKPDFEKAVNAFKNMQQELDQKKK